MLRVIDTGVGRVVDMLDRKASGPRGLGLTLWMRMLRLGRYRTLLMMHSSVMMVMMFLVLHPLHEADMLVVYLLACIVKRPAAEFSNRHTSIDVAASAVAVGLLVIGSIG